MAHTAYKLSQYKFKTPELLYITNSKYEKDWISLMHTHTATELIYMVKGSGTLKICKKTYNIKQGDFIAIPAHFMHTEESSVEDPVEYYVMGVANVKSAYKNEEDYDPMLKIKVDKEKAINYIFSLYKEIENKEIGYRLKAKSLLLDFIVFLQRENGININFDETSYLRTEIESVKSFIDTNYEKQMTLDYIAEIASISKFHLIREFSKYLGLTPIDYLNEQRIGKAKILLGSSTMNIAEIGSSVGFTSPSYFTQRFKLSVGLTPKKYKTTLERKKNAKTT